MKKVVLIASVAAVLAMSGCGTKQIDWIFTQELIFYNRTGVIVCSKSDNYIWNKQTKKTYISIEEAEKKYKKDNLGYFRTSDPGTYSFDSLVKHTTVH